MTLAFFKFGLPVILGYTLFIGISGRWNPVAMPDDRTERASWLLGLWAGACVCVVLIVAMYKAHSAPANAVNLLLMPSLALIVVLVAPALALFTHFHYGRRKNAAGTEPTMPIDKFEPETTPNNTAVASPDLSIVTTLTNEPTNVNLSHTVTADALKKHDMPTEENKGIDATEDNVEIHAKLAAEIALREETEKHLRITRKALSVLEADTRHFSIDKADGIIALEEKLAESIEAATMHESGALREKVRRMELEQDITDLKQKMVKAKQELRRGAAARARALSTANKSIAFARQCVQVRERLESKLTEAQTTIDVRQKAISKLLQDLEKQKRRTQDEVSSMAKQLVLHEKQLKARRSLEQVARSVENKLTSRLVKKVAKAKPLTPGLNQGETG